MVSRFASDELLVARVRSGSAPAFEALFQRHHRPLHAFCRRMLGSAADAEDAVQHTFMAAYADMVRSDRPIALRPWLYAIARHRCLTLLRARRERPVAELPDQNGDDLATAVDSREELRATFADIARLPEDQRAALVLAELGDASHAEIAQIVGCRQEKVKALVFQARSALATGRTARDTPCAEVREQLAAGGVAMRRTPLRRHVRDCEGCREFGEQLRVQRRRLRILLPFAPGLGFKRALAGLLPAAGGGGAAAGAGGLAATAVVTAAIAGSGATAAPPGAAASRTAATTATTVTPASSARRHAARVTRTEKTKRARLSRPANPGAPDARRDAPARPDARRPKTAPSAAAPAAAPPALAPGTEQSVQPGGGAAEAPGQAEQPSTASPPAGKPRTEPPARPRPEPPGKPPELPGKPEAPGRPAVPPAPPVEPPAKPGEPPGQGGAPAAQPLVGGRGEAPQGRPEDAGRPSP